MSQRTRDSDTGNAGFSFRNDVVHHKPGFEKAATHADAEARGNHRFRARDEKDVPKESLAARLAKSAKGS